MEILVVGGIVCLLIGLAVSGLKSGSSQTSTVGLAVALSDEFRAARLAAISQGRPVAVGFPRTDSDVSNSVYRLQGWNTPQVTRSVSFEGDYPNLGIACAKWSGADFVTNVSPSPLFKFRSWDLDAWIPEKLRGDAILCFLPDGSVVGNDLPSLKNRYTVVLARDLVVNGKLATAGDEACVIYVSADGGVNYKKGTPGGVLDPGTPVTRSKVRSRDQLTGSASIRMSDIRVRPEPDDTAADAFCTPGQQITFEVYAYDPEGRQLFAQWNQTGPGQKLGNFTFPRSQGDNLTSEVERMEFLAQPPAGINWGNSTAPDGGCFVARWTWTVPQNSSPGDLYTVEADIQDASGTADILNPPPPVSLKASPSGRLLAEVFNNGRWELVRMNPDGSGRELLTPPGVEESMPSVDGTGTKLAFLQGPIGNPNQRYVKIRSLSGGGEFQIAGPGRYTSVSLSPNGAWISYRLDSATNRGEGTLFLHRVDQIPASGFSESQNFLGPDVIDIEPCRTGWSLDSKIALWGNRNFVRGADLGSGGAVSNVRDIYKQTKVGDIAGTENQVYAPAVFNPDGGQDRLLFTVSSSNPVIVHTMFRPDRLHEGNAREDPPSELPAHKIDLNGAQADTGSGAYDDNFAFISKNGRKVILPRIDRPAGNKRYALIARWDQGQQNFVANPNENNTIRENIRCVVWIP